MQRSSKVEKEVSWSRQGQAKTVFWREIGLFRSYRKPSEAGTGPGQEEDRRLAQAGEVVQLKKNS